jgi:hypothetical protein
MKGDIETWIEFFVELSRDEIIEGARASKDGKCCMLVCPPGVSEEIEVECSLKGLLGDHGNNKEVLEWKRC